MNMFIPKVIEKPWGKEVICAHTPDYVGKMLYINQGEQLSIQYHNHKDETMYIVSGSGLINFFEMDERGHVVLETRHAYSEGQSYYIPPKKIHNVIADADTVIFESSTNYLDDIVRISDKYGRK